MANIEMLMCYNKIILIGVRLNNHQQKNEEKAVKSISSKNQSLKCYKNKKPSFNRQLL